MTNMNMHIERRVVIKHGRLSASNKLTKIESHFKLERNCGEILAVLSLDSASHVAAACCFLGQMQIPFILCLLYMPPHHQ